MYLKSVYTSLTCESCSRHLTADLEWLSMSAVPDFQRSAERRDFDELLQRSRIVIHNSRQRIWRTFELYAGSRDLMQASRELQEALTERRLAQYGREPLYSQTGP